LRATRPCAALLINVKTTKNNVTASKRRFADERENLHPRRRISPIQIQPLERNPSMLHRSPICHLSLLAAVAMIGCQSSMPAPLAAAGTTAVRTARTTTTAAADVAATARNTVAATVSAVRLTLADITGPARDNDDQISNMAIAGFLVSHDLNTGQVVVDGDMWQQMSPTDQQVAGRIIQQYQNRNIPRPVIIRTAPSHQARASAG
jgi:hypothetical protein